MSDVCVVFVTHYSGTGEGEGGLTSDTLAFTVPYRFPVKYPTVCIAGILINRVSHAHSSLIHHWDQNTVLC